MTPLEFQLRPGEEDHWSVYRWEIKTCLCGFTRKVKIIYRRKADGSYVQEDGYHLCGACEADRRASGHELAAQKFRAKAREIRAKRQTRRRK